jgi:hypothetical protein
MTTARIKSLQQVLHLNGFYTGPIDGIAGDRTQDSLKLMIRMLTEFRNLLDSEAP